MALAELLFGRRADGGSWFPSGADVVGGGPSSNFWYSLVRQPTASGVSVNEDVALTYSAVFCATMRRVGTMSSLPKNLYRKRARVREVAEDRREHWLIRRRPNPLMLASRFHATMEEWRLNRGNAYAEIQWEETRDGRRALWLWPIHPSRVRPVFDPDEMHLWYEVRNGGDGDVGYLPAEDVIHLTSLLTRDGVTGVGTIEQARESIGFGVATERHGASQFGANTIPPIVVKTPKMMSPDARTAFRKEWREIHEDARNNVALLTEGADIAQLSFNLEDMQFLSTRQHNVEEISRWYDLPPHMLHHLLRMTNNNIEHQGIEAVVYSFLPWITPAEEEYLCKLIPDEEEQREYYFKWEVNGLLRGDMQARAQFYHQMIADGVFTPNMVLELEDWNPFEGGDSHYIQGAMARIQPDGSLEMAAKAEAEPEDDLAPPEPPDDDAGEPEQDDASEAESRLRAVARGLLTACLQRLVVKETIGVRRAAQSPGKFLNEIAAFYKSHRATVAKESQPVLDACVAFGASGDGVAWADALCAQSEMTLLQLAGRCTADTLATEVDALMSEWEATRAASIVDGISELS